MNEGQLLRIHRDPLDPWEPAHAAACIINTQIALYPHNHDLAFAAKQLDALTPFNRKIEPDEEPEDIESFLWEFWEVVVNLSQAYGDFGIEDEAQRCIVEIIGELKKIEAKEVMIWGNKTRLWGSLPIFGPVLTELYGMCQEYCDGDVGLQGWFADMSQHSEHFRAFLDKIQAAGLIEVRI